VELIVVMLVTAIILGAVLAAFGSMSGMFHSEGVRIQNQDDARNAVNQVARYIRMATSSADNLTTQTNAIAAASPQDLVFYCDVDGDETAEKVRYYLNGTTLMMQTAEPVWIVGTSPHWEYQGYQTAGEVIQDAVRNGSAAIFKYYRYTSGVLQQFTPSSASDRQDVVTVAISLTVNERPDLAKGAVVLATDVQIRQRYEGGLQ
jgi:hypothetical protein